MSKTITNDAAIPSSNVFSSTFTSGSDHTGSLTIICTKIGDSVTLQLPAASIASLANDGLFTNDTPLPNWICPIGSVEAQMVCQQGTNIAASSVTIQFSGVMIIYFGSYTSFAFGEIAGWPKQTITYNTLSSPQFIP